ncbi:hypothetical protein BH09PAT4_BH09PAT4_01700 [soil metagenome]
MRKNVIITITLGVVLGLFTSFGQTYLPDPFTQLANSYSVWLLFAFICGLFMSRFRWALLSGAVVQYVALATYYSLLHIRFSDGSFNISSNVIWLIGGTLVGPLASLAGKLYSVRSKWSVYALSFIVGLILSESLYQFIRLKYVGEGLVFLVLSLAVAAVLLWDYQSRVKVILPTIIVTATTYISYAYIVTAIFN